jgi:hypothetical protein
MRAERTRIDFMNASVFILYRIRKAVIVYITAFLILIWVPLSYPLYRKKKEAIANLPDELLLPYPALTASFQQIVRLYMRRISNERPPHLDCKGQVTY